MFSVGIQLLRSAAQAIRAQWPLVLLFYAVGAALTTAWAQLLIAPLQAVVGASGFDAAMADGFDLHLWFDIFEANGVAILGTLHHLAWIVPCSFLWKASASVGLMHALSGEGHAFWRGALRYMLPSALLGVIFLGLIVVTGGMVVVVAFIADGVNMGEVPQFWLLGVFVPALGAALISAFTVMRDVARAALVVGGQSLIRSFSAGLAVPLKERDIWIPFVACVALGSALAGLSAIGLVQLSDAGVALPLAIQQLLQVLIAAVIVGWYGSLVAYVQRAAHRFSVDETASLAAKERQEPSNPVEKSA